MNDSLSHTYMSTLEEGDTLAHIGVKGMKWGKRKASAQSLVSSRGGRKGGAVAAEVGKMAAVNVITTAGVIAINQAFPKNPTVRLGAQIAAAVIQGGALANGVANIAAVAGAEGAKKQ